MPKVREIRLSGRGETKIAIIPLKGVIATEAQNGGLRSKTHTSVVGMELYLKTARRDPRIKAVILKINSPGGSASASDEIHHLVESVKEKGIKVISFIQEIGASGAYNVAAASDKIVATPNSLIGSIGAIMQIINVEEAFKKLGLKAITIKSGESKDTGSPFRRMIAKEKQELQKLINECKESFVETVKKGRPTLKISELDTITSGRVFSAEKALEYGLIDQIGYFDDVLKAVKELCGTTDVTFVTYRPQVSLFDSLLALQSRMNDESLPKLIKEFLSQRNGELLQLWQPDVK